MEREELEKEYGQVWDTQELMTDFSVIAFGAPYCSVERRSDGVRGTMQFQHMPRFYWGFLEN